jgi:hypothetical protein
MHNVQSRPSHLQSLLPASQQVVQDRPLELLFLVIHNIIANDFSASDLSEPCLIIVLRVFQQLVSGSHRLYGLHWGLFREGFHRKDMERVDADPKTYSRQDVLNL